MAAREEFVVSSCPLYCSNVASILESSAPKTTAFNNDEEYESEERDPPMGQGFFVQSVRILI